MELRTYMVQQVDENNKPTKKLYINSWCTLDVQLYLRKYKVKYTKPVYLVKGPALTVISGVEVVLNKDGTVYVGPKHERFWLQKLDVSVTAHPEGFAGLIDEADGSVIALVRKDHADRILAGLRILTGIKQKEVTNETISTITRSGG